MTKNIKRSILFALLFLTVVVGLQATVDLCYKKTATDKFSRLFKHKTDAEIMIFGSSLAYHHFHSGIIFKKTGLSTYNMGWDGLFFIQFNSLVKEYLSYETAAKYIVLVCGFDNNLRNTGLITRPDMFLAYLNNDHVYESLHEMEPEKMLKAKYVPGYKLTLLNKQFYKALVYRSPEKDPENGYAPIPAGWNIVADTLEEFTTKDTIKHFAAEYDEAVYTSFKQTVNQIVEKGIKVILVMPPCYKNVYQAIKNVDFIKSKYSSLAGEKVYFLDYTQDSLCNSKEWFHDYSHLNAKGVPLFSSTFADDLKKIINQ